MEAEEATTYEPLGGRRNRNRSDSPDIDLLPPKDHKHLVYVSLMTAGIGFVLPYNSFIMAADYWRERFPGELIELDMSMTYIIVAFATVLGNNILLSLASFRARIIFGYVVSFTTLVFVALCEVAWHMFGTKAYSVNLAAVSLVAMGCTVQQSTFYGFASMLPKKYTQAVMAGESVAGVLVSANRMMTKFLIHTSKASTVIFFLSSTTYVAFSYVLHSTVVQSSFVRYYMKSCSKIILRPDEERTENIMDESKSNRNGGVSSSTSETTATTGFSFSNPVYDLSNPTSGENTLPDLSKLPDTIETQQPQNVVFKVEHIITPASCSGSSFGDFKSGLESRWRVAHAIYPYMVCIALAYCVTISLYPEIISQIKSCRLDSWMPVLLMFTFNACDLIGKILAAVPYSWSRRQLMLMSGLRAVLVPLILLCCTPRLRPVIAGETAPFIFTSALGLTNGLAGSLPMMLAPSKVPGTLKEVTGNIMTLSYNVGLTAGVFIAYIFNSMLGSQEYPCPKYPFVPSRNITVTSLTTTTMSTTIATTLSTSQYLNTSSVLTTVFDAITRTTPITPTTSVATESTATSILTSTLSNYVLNNIPLSNWTNSTSTG